MATEKARLVEARRVPPSLLKFAPALRKTAGFFDPQQFELSEQELASRPEGRSEPDLELADTVRSIEDSVAKAVPSRIRI